MPSSSITKGVMNSITNILSMTFNNVKNGKCVRSSAYCM